MFLARHKFALLSLLISSLASTAIASPSIYPTGVTRYDPSKAFNSYVLFAGSDKKTHLIDLNGNEVHQWPYNGFPSVFLDPQLTGGKRGHVLVQLTGDTGGRNTGDSQSLREVDWDNKVIWQWGGAKAQDAYATATTSTDASSYGTEIRQHHDWRRLPNGNTLVLINYVRPVTGFKAEKILEDGIYEI